jgi:hypothetical protein
MDDTGSTSNFTRNITATFSAAARVPEAALPTAPVLRSAATPTFGG